MKKSIFLIFAAILCAIGMNAADITSDGTARLYFNMNAVSWWKSSNGENNFAYFFKDSKYAWSAHSVQHSGNTYYVIIPKGTWNTVILTRNDTKTSPSWNNKWNQTGDITLSSTSNYISTFSDDGEGTFGTAVKPVSTASVSSSSSSVFVGAPANLTAALTSNADINTVKSVAYSTTTGASISGSTFTATAEGTYTVTATVTYHPNGYPSITSTATATTDITVTVPAEEVHDVTVSYMCGSTEIADETKISSVGVETEGDAVAPAKIKGYNFVNWTIGDGVINQTGDNTAREIKINTKSTGTYTLIANYEPETVYFVNTDEWAVVNVYAWVEDGIKNGEWPGEELTPTGEKIGGYDVYRYTSGEGYENVIFNDKVGSNASKQTPDLVWTNGKYYVYNGQTSVDADDWYAKVDVEGALPDWFATNVYLVGSMFANWDKTPDKEFRKATKDATTANIVVNLDAGKEYELKVRRGDDWTSYTSKITNTVTGLQFSSSNNDNCKMKTTVAGDYTFTWTISSSKLDVTYPTLYEVTATANDAAMGTVAGAGNYGKGSTATLTATPNDGYLFVNWTKGGEVVANTQEYSFEVTEAVELVANFEEAAEEVRNVTVSYVCGGNKIADDQTVTSVGKTTAKTVEAPEIWGYTFSSWTLGEDVTSADAPTSSTIDINIVADGSDFTLTANYTEIPKVTVYFVNNKKWSKVYAYGWGGSVGENPAWPGQEITANKEAEQIAGFDVHSYSVVPGSYVNIKFTNNSGTESANFKWTDGKYYYMDAVENYAGGTIDEVTTAVTPYALATDVYLAGEMTNWDTNKKEFKKATSDATSASVTVNLTAKTYKFKLIIGEGNWRGNTGTMKRGGTSVHEGGWSFEEEGGDDKNCQIVADIAGDYTFTWNLTDKKLTVAYPPLPKYTVTATAENGSVTGAGEYEHGSEATLVATPDAGYAFKNWTKGGEEVSTEATYTFTVTADVELVANFVPEETHEVTVSYLCNATPIPGQTTQTLAVGVTTPSTISAPAITNYKFDSWTLGTGVQSEDATTANPIQITTLAAGEYTLAANYTKIELTYTVKVPEGTEKCYIAGDMNSWSFQEMTPTANANEFTITIDGATTDHKYKYTCGEGWAYVEKKEDGSDLDADRTYNANDVVAKWAEPAKCYLMGIGGDWTTGIEMEEDGDQFKLLCQPIAEGEQFKFKYGDTWSDGVKNHDFPGINWVDDDEDGNSNITLPAGNYNFYYEKATNQVYIEAATDCGPETITLTTGDNSAVIAANIGNTVNVVIERSFTANDGYYTLCVPFNMDPSVIGKAYSLGSITEHVAGEGININLVEETYELSAGVPYLVLPKANMSELVVENVTIQSDEASGQNITNEALNVQIFFEGFYSASGQTNGSTEYYVGEHGYLYNGVVDKRGLSGLFTITDTEGNPAKVRARVVTREDEATGFENITSGENTTIKLIENGQLIIIRNGEKFNAQGQKL